MSLRNTMLVSAIALAPLAASASGPECEVVDGVIVEECDDGLVGKIGGVAGDVPGDGLGLPDIGELNVTNFVPAFLPLILVGGAAAAAVVLDGSGSSNGTR